MKLFCSSFIEFKRVNQMHTRKQSYFMNKIAIEKRKIDLFILFLILCKEYSNAIKTPKKINKDLKNV